MLLFAFLMSIKNTYMYMPIELIKKNIEIGVRDIKTSKDNYTQPLYNQIVSII